MNGIEHLLYMESVFRAGPGHHHADLRGGHQSGCRLGRNAEPHQARRGAPAGRRAPRRRHRGEVGAQLPDVRRARFAGQEPRQRGARQLCRRQRAGQHPPRAGRGRGAAVRHRVLDAPVAEAGKTACLQPLARRCQRGGARAEHAAGHRRTRPVAGSARPAVECGHRHPEPAVHAGRIRQHHRARQSGWFHACASRMWRAWNWARRTIPLRRASTASRPRPSPSACRPSANALDTAKAVKAKMAELAKFFPKGVDWWCLTTPPSSSRFPSAKW